MDEKKLGTVAKKWGIFLALFSVFIASFFLLGDHLIPFVVKRLVISRAKGVHLEHFSYAKCKWRKHGFILTELDLKVHTESFDGHMHVPNCQFRLSWNNASKAYFSFDKPEVALTFFGGSPMQKGGGLSYESLSKMLLPSVGVQVQGGKGVCQVMGRHYHFDFDVPLGVKQQFLVHNLKEGSALHAISKPGSDLAVTVTKHKDVRQLHFHLASQRMDLGLVGQGLSYYLQKRFEGLSSVGVASGVAHFSYSNKLGIEPLSADVQLTGVNLRHKRYPGRVAMQEGRLAFNMASHKKKGRGSPLALVPYLDFLGDYSHFNIEVRGGYLGYQLGPADKLIEIKGIDIKTEYEDSYLHHHHFKGDLHYAGHMRPLLLMGSESKSQINFYHQSACEEKNRSRWQCFFSFGSHGAHPCLDYSLEVPSMSPDEINALMSLGSGLFQKQDYLALSIGGLKTYMRGELSDAHHYLRVHYLEADQLAYQDNQMGVKAGHATLRCNLDLKKDHFYQHGSWDFKVQEGFFEKERHQFERIQFQGGMNGTYVKPSLLRFAWLGKETQCQFEGLLSHLNAEVETSFLPLEIKRVLSSGICLESKQPLASKEVKVNLSMGVDATFSQIRTEGVCKLEMPLAPDQEVDFALNFTGSEKAPLVSPLPTYDFLMGWFKSDKLNAEILNMIFYLLDKEWLCEGHVDVEGSLNQKMAQINVDPTHVRFATDMAILYQDPNLSKKAPRLNFTFDYATNHWTGALPLDKVVFDVPAFGLKFTSFSSNLSLEGEVFTFRDIKATSYEGLECAANMVIDFSTDGLANLSIDASSGQGSVTSLTQFLNHFEPFSGLKLPGEGRVALGKKGHLHVEATLGDKEELTVCKIGAEVFDYDVPISGSCHLTGGKAQVRYDSSEKLFTLSQGQAVFEGDEVMAKHKDWRLKLKEFNFHAMDDKGEASILMSSPTYDLLALKGAFEKNEQGWVLECNPQATHVLGSPLDKFHLCFDRAGGLKDFDIGGTASALSLYGMLDLIATTELATLPPQLLYSIRSPQFKGELHYQVTGQEYLDRMDVLIKGEGVQVGKVSCDKVNIAVNKRHQQIDFTHVEVGDFTLTGGAEVRNNRVMTKNVAFSFKDSFCHVGEGSFLERGRMSFKESFFTLYQGGTTLPVLNQYPGLKKLGKIKGDGHLEVVFAHDLEAMHCFGKLGVSFIDCGEKGVCIDSLKPFSFELDAQGNLKVCDAELFMKEESDPNVWIKANLAEGFFNLSKRDKPHKLEAFHLVVPPEAVSFIASKSYVPGLSAEEGKLSFSGTEFVWENQIEADLDVSIGKTLDVKAAVKEGYYWLGGQAWFLEKVHVGYDGSVLEASLGVKKEEVDLQIKAKGGWQKEVFATLELQEGQLEEDKCLQLSVASNESEGIFIQSIEGSLCGLTCSLYHNPRASLIEQMVLTGGVRVNGYELARYLPQEAKTVMEKFEIGRGYELSGDLVLFKRFSEFSKSHFSGFFKGKHMEFCGSEIETLMSEINIYPKLITLKNCHISDAAGLFEIPEMRIEYTVDERWRLLMDTLRIQDFRPSLIKKVGVYRGKIKPLVIRSFAMEDIEGYIDDMHSFKGSGQFAFINTFKRDSHILDIPLEILGRLGLDMGLLIPVRGSIEFLLEEGIVHFLDLSQAYSHGDRSEFFLSKKELSYIDLEGNLNIHIKMKQHVLLKITQPFTLSILGDVASPKYSLH